MTRIAIVHRPETLAAADRIVRLDPRLAGGLRTRDKGALPHTANLTLTDLSA